MRVINWQHIDTMAAQFRALTGKLETMDSVVNRRWTRWELQPFVGRIDTLSKQIRSFIIWKVEKIVISHHFLRVFDIQANWVFNIHIRRAAIRLDSIRFDSFPGDHHSPSHIAKLQCLAQKSYKLCMRLVRRSFKRMQRIQCFETFKSTLLC